MTGKLNVNYHTHNHLCNHASGEVSDYVKKAVELGMEQIGLSDHNPVSKDMLSKDDYDYNWVGRNMKEEEFHNVYLPEIEKAVELYGDKISIKKGLECEYILNYNSYYKNFLNYVDYLVLGLHYFNSEDKVINTYADVNYENIYDYLEVAREAMSTGYYTIFAHPDLFMWSYKNEDGENVFDKHCEEVTKKIIEYAVEYDVILEINANGVLNSARFADDKIIYPYKRFWEIVAKDKRVKVIIGADCHAPELLEGEHIKFCQELASELNIVSINKPIFK